MAQKTIIELTAATDLDANAVFPFDSSIQTFKMTAPNVAKALRKFSLAFVTQTTTYDILLSDELVRGDVSAGAFTVTLPTIASSSGRSFFVKNISNSVNLLTVKGNGSELVDFSNTVDLGSGESLEFLNNGTSWDIL